MKKIYLFLCLCVGFMWVQAQEKTVIPVELEWNGTEHWSISDSLYTDVIALEQASYQGENHLPYYHYELPADKTDEYRAELKNGVFVPVSSDELPLLDDVELSAQPLVSARMSGSRKQLYYGVSVCPFVERDGQILKLKSFDLELTRYKRSGTAVESALHSFAAKSVLSEGRFVKVRVTESGVYKLTYADLRSKGIDPANVRLFGYGGAVLDEDFSKQKPDDLPEVAVYDTGDAILFYAQGVNKWTYNAAAGKFTHEINPYSTYGYYFVTSDDVGTRKRIAQGAKVTAEAVSDVSVFTDYAVYERESASVNRSGRKLYEQVNTGSSVTASFSFPNVVKSENVEVRTEVARDKNYFSLRLNGGGAKGISSSDNTFTTSSDQLSFMLSYTGSGIGYLDYIEVNVRRALAMTGAYMTFHNRENLGGHNRYRLTAGSSVRVWNINDLANVQEVPLEVSGGTLTFVDDAMTAKSYAAVDLNAVSSIPSATLLDEVPRQNVHGMASVDMLIITNPAFKAAAESLARAHAELDGLNVGVVTADEVYNEFSSGTPDATAYRWAAKMLYERQDVSLRYLLLFGKGSFDNRGMLSGTGNRLLLTYQSANSVAEDKESYTTDDYFGFLDDNEGVSLGNRDKLDISIGRFPVVTEEQAWAVVEKTISYMRNDTPGAWKNQLCFLGDDGDGNTHMEQANGVADAVAGIRRGYNVNKILLDAYQQEVNASGQTYPLAKNRFENLIRMGLLYINYMGHANVNGWTNENILLTHEIKNMTNQCLPLVSAGTCEFSRYDKEYVSGGEELVLTAQGGAIGCFSATRSVYPGPNYSLMRAFAETLFPNSDNENMAVGDAIMLAKNTLTSDPANKLAYVYFGDPSVRLNYPNRYDVVLQEINGKPVAGNDTLRALSEVKVKACVLDRQGNKASHFKGTAQIIVYDKQVSVTTLNNDGDLAGPFSYTDYSNILFKGTAAVQNGEFSVTFRLPKDIKYNYGSGRMVFTVWNETGNEGGQGYNENFIIGGSSSTAENVTSGPQVELYLNHKGFVSGGKVDETPVFMAHLYDENGINISSPTPGHDIMLMLNDNQSFVLNDYYESELDTYKEGTVTYQLPKLEEGHYTLMFRAWNLYNVSTMEYLDFEVVKDLKPEIFSVTCFPNPATTQTTIQVKHDREDEMIDMTVDVYDLSGKRVWSESRQSANYITWDLSTANGKLLPGVYIYRVSVKSDDKIVSYRANKLLIK